MDEPRADSDVRFALAFFGGVGGGGLGYLAGRYVIGPWLSPVDPDGDGYEDIEWTAIGVITAIITAIVVAVLIWRRSGRRRP